MNNNKIILKEGYTPIAIAVVITLFLNIFISDTLANIALIITIFLVIIYRNPNRSSFDITNDNIISPIDGKISAIDIGKHNYKIYIDVNLCNTHQLRSPLSGKFKIKNLKKGLNLNSATYKAKLLNSQALLKIKDIKIKLISGICNSDIILYDEKDVAVGESIGVFLNGLVIVEIPKDYKLNISIGDKVDSGITKLV